MPEAQGPRHPPLRQAAIRVGLAVVAWSGLCVALDQAGHAPSGPTLLDRWYRVQAVVVFVVLPLQAWVAEWVAQRLQPTPEARGAVASALGTGLLVFLVVDIAAWVMLGFEWLGVVLAVSAPLCVALIFGLGARRFVVHGRSWAQALGAVTAGVLVALILGGPLLR
jgi:hypothetical protein